MFVVVIVIICHGGESEVLEDLPNLLEGHEQHHGEGALPGDGGDEALVQGHRPLRPDRLHGAVQRPGVRRRLPRLHLHVHHPGLDHVDRVRPGRHVGPEPVPHRAALQDRLLDLVVGRQLGRGHHHGAVHREAGPAPQARHPLLLRHARDGVHHAPVVSALVRREPPVRLHPDHGHVGRVPDHGADGPGHEPGGDLAGQGQGVGPGVRPLLLEDVVQPHAGG
ncbi:hypothetical protein EUGRSUZ_F00409 [Eucalyptus grandis]|uniref:Uncharacterized protein n=2 Tax=Eucalyptus grandis TaxID=71139 RepID=A0ACC3KAS6_EUCGR|nr:hypothetical protein EUGRSUZ_F00409 [Eucalyptus grandis]